MDRTYFSYKNMKNRYVRCALVRKEDDAKASALGAGISQAIFYLSSVYNNLEL